MGSTKGEGMLKQYCCGYESVGSSQGAENRGGRREGKIVEEAKTIADKKKTISDWELEALANDDALVESAAWEVLHHTFVTAAQLGERG